MENRLLGPYITRQKNDDKPAGSRCIAYRTPSDILLLVFEDGSSVEVLNGYAEGLEPMDRSNIFEIMSLKASQDVQAEEDAKLLDYLDKASKSCQ